MRCALARVCADLLSMWAWHDANRTLLASAQREQERWHCESPSTDALYKYVAQLADSWLHSLALPVNTAVNAARIASLRMQEKWQAHAKTTHLGRTHRTLLRQQLVHEEPATVEAELCE